jgi:hypothetical protein
MSFSKPPDASTGWGDEFRFAVDAANWVTSGLPSGDLSAYWRFDDASGTSLLDATGNGNTGTWTGTLANAQWGTGKVRGCGVFNGTDRIVTVADAALLKPTTALSLSLWLNPGATQPAFATPIGKSGSYWLEMNGTANSNSYTFFLNNGADLNGGYTTLTSGVWSHLALTWDGTTATTYLNGAVVQSIAVAPPLTANTNALVMGNRPGFTRFYSGSMDEVGFWPRALSQDDITSIYNGGVGATYGIPANRIGPGALAHYNGNLGFFGKAPATQGTTPVTLADVIALLQRYGLSP